MKVRELLSDESKWCQGSFAKDRNGLDVSIHSSEAVCWCLSGATAKCYGWGENWGWRIIRSDLQKSRISGGIGSWNDTHSYQEVKELVDRLDI
jgi:hypothetical protein